ncbi:hypothetical protein MESS4_790045 [Mesorhizobium sp. STM 4661]|nr:hypothetical protein MESS4_790045 [Mesorhizobium sp. STM 4661]
MPRCCRPNTKIGHAVGSSIRPNQGRFHGYTDARIQTSARVTLVREMFQISHINLVVSGDSHYRPPPAASFIADDER